MMKWLLRTGTHFFEDVLFIMSGTTPYFMTIYPNDSEDADFLAEWIENNIAGMKEIYYRDGHQNFPFEIYLSRKSDLAMLKIIVGGRN